jgi:hypothetical protein
LISDAIGWIKKEVIHAEGDGIIKNRLIEFKDLWFEINLEDRNLCITCIAKQIMNRGLYKGGKIGL